jgi:hypothetical protein
VVRVHCPNCGACYDTDLPVKAVRRIRRCSRCGFAALELVAGCAEDAAEPAEEPDEH